MWSLLPPKSDAAPKKLTADTHQTEVHIKLSSVSGVIMLRRSKIFLLLIVLLAGISSASSSASASSNAAPHPAASQQGHGGGHGHAMGKRERALGFTKLGRSAFSLWFCSLLKVCYFLISPHLLFPTVPWQDVRKVPCQGNTIDTFKKWCASFVRLTRLFGELHFSKLFNFKGFFKEKFFLLKNGGWVAFFSHITYVRGAHLPWELKEKGPLCIFFACYIHSYYFRPAWRRCP